MFKIISMLSLILLSTVLVGCGPIYQTEYNYVPPKASMGKMCVSQCIQNKSMCEQMCQMRNETCRTRAHQDALYEFEVYKREQHRKGQAVDRSVQDFDRSYSCNTTCDCTPTFNTCYSACGGQVLERQVCVAFCNK